MNIKEDLWNAIENFDIKNCPTEILFIRKDKSE